MVGADVGGEHGVVFLADLEDALARLHVEGDGQARLPAAAAAGQQQVAVAAELEHVDRALGERQDADQVVVGRPVEQHLLVPADRPPAGPRGWRPSPRWRPAWPAATNGSVDEVLGHRRRARRLAQRRRVELELELRLGLRPPPSLPEFSSAPPSIHLRISVDLGVGDLGRVGRHLRLFLVRDHAQERAAVGIARLDDLARAAALHRRAVVVEVQAPLLLVGVVAGAAPAAEDRRDVVLSR